MNKKFVYKELTKQIFRNVSWLAVLFQVALLVIVVYPIFVEFANSIQHPDYEIISASLFDYSLAPLNFALLVFPIILGMFLFNFMMKRTSSDFIQGLPISKNAVYFHHVVIGITLIIIPIVVTAFVSWGLVHAPGFPADAAANLMCLEWILFASGISLISFAFSTIAALVSGNFKVQGIISAGILLMPIIFTVSVESIISRFIYGFAFDLSTLGGVTQSVVLIVIASVILWAMCNVYKCRKVEGISEPIVFEMFKPVFKILFALLALLGAADVMQDSIGVSTFRFILIILASSLVGYIFTLIVLGEYQIKWKNYRMLLGFWGLFLIGLLGLNFYASTYDYAIPEPSEVSEVTIEHEMPISESNMNSQLKVYMTELRTLSEQESIEVVTEMHKKVVDQKPATENDYEYYSGFTITYKLDNGKEVSRSYDYASKEAFTEFVSEVTNLPEFRENLCVFLDTVVRENTSYITFVFGSDWVDGPLSDTQEFNSLIDALIEDVKVVSEFTFDEPSDYTLLLTSYTYSINVSISSEYINTIQWLEDNGFKEEAAMLENS